MSVFIAVLTAMVVCETFAPRRTSGDRTGRRWLSHLMIGLLDAVVIRLVFPVAAFAVAVIAEARGWGILNQLDLPFWLACIGSIVLLDMVIYFQHRLFHVVPVLWRLHRVHHADDHFDVSTGLRFHPGEICLSMLLKMAVVALLGAPAAAVLGFEVILSATSLFTHANLRLPARLDHFLRRAIVTPDMHRIHHSMRPEETCHNFGFSLSLWDRVFTTYQAEPADQHETMTLGVRGLSSAEENRFHRILLQPLK